MADFLIRETTTFNKKDGSTGTHVSYYSGTLRIPGLGIANVWKPREEAVKYETRRAAQNVMRANGLCRAGVEIERIDEEEGG